MDVKAIVNKHCEGREGVPQAQGDVDTMVRIFWSLLQADGCPWDKKQTHQSLSRFMLEEAYEAADAMESGDIANLKEELGDVLLQVALHSAIAERDGEFTLADVVRGLNEKIVRRHPHVFGDEQADNDGDVLSIWQKVKAEERAVTEEDIFSGIPLSQPALLQAQLLQDRCAENDLPVHNVLENEEILAHITSLSNESLSSEEAEECFGNALFSLVSLARAYNIDAERSLRNACCAYRNDFKASSQE